MDFSKLLTQIDSVSNKKTHEADATYWKLTKDKTGNAAAVIHFLPNKNIEDIPFVRMYKHNFKNPATNRWYIENSLTTIGEQDYIAEVNKELWNTGLEENKKIVSSRKRKLQYIANILVVKDLGNPENDGKVFKYAFGPKIWDKIVAAAKPEEALGEEPISAFDPINGADFLLKMTYNAEAEQYNYDASKFNSKKPMFGGDDDKIEAVLAQCYDLNQEIAPDKFKSYEELKKKFLWVLGQEDKAAKPSKAQQEQFDSDDDELAALAEMVKADKKAEEKPKTAPAKERKSPPVPVASLDEDSDDEFFKELLK